MSAAPPIPRYTSYPPASVFREGIGEAELRAALAASNEDPIPPPLSIYVHVPFCTSPCFFCACNRIITRDRALGASYVSRLHREFDLVARCLDRDREVVQLHLGGGTPNFLPVRLLAELAAALRAQFRFAGDAERDQSIELDPRAATPEDIAGLVHAGFNRVSFGIQDFDPEVQRAINRVQDAAHCGQLVEACRASGIRSVGMDLILGLPRQTPDTLARTMDRVVEMRPDRLAIYEYAHMPGRFPAQRQIAKAGLPSSAATQAMRERTETVLTGAGYVPIGFDHFALPGDGLARARDEGRLHRNFMGYATHAGCDLLGFGVSAISHVGDGFFQNARELAAWEQAIDAGRLATRRGWLQSADDCLRAELIEELLCLGEVDLAAFAARHGIDVATYFARELHALEPFAREGVVTASGGRLRVDSQHRALLRRIAACFDRYTRVPG